MGSLVGKGKGGKAKDGKAKEGRAKDGRANCKVGRAIGSTTGRVGIVRLTTVAKVVGT